MNNGEEFAFAQCELVIRGCLHCTIAMRDVFSFISLHASQNDL